MQEIRASDPDITEQIEVTEPTPEVTPDATNREVIAALGSVLKVLEDIRNNTTRPAREPMPEKIDDEPSRPSIYDL